MGVVLGKRARAGGDRKERDESRQVAAYWKGGKKGQEALYWPACWSRKATGSTECWTSDERGHEEGGH